MRTACIVLLSLLSVAAVRPVHAADPAPAALPRSTPEAQGVSSAAILGFIEEAEQKIDALHSFMLVRHGHVVAEGWWTPYAAGEPHMMFSLSKSFTATAVGLAVADGKLSVDDPVVSFFPDEAPAEPGENLKAMRVRDLLTMTAGHHQEDLRDFPYGSEESVVKKFLALPVAHGQFCLVLPQYDAVVAITTGTRDMASVMNLVWDRLVPALKPSALPAATSAHRKLAAKLESLVLPPQSGGPRSPAVKEMSGARYVFAENPHKLESIALESVTPAGEASFSLRIADADQRVTAASGTWRKGTFTIGGNPDPIAASGAWTADDTYSLTIARYHTPFVTACRLRFSEQQLAMDCEQNVGPPATRAMQLVGRREPALTGSRE